MRKIVLILVSLALAIYTSICLSIYFAQRRLEYFPSHLDKLGEGDGMYDPWRDDKGNLIGYLRPAVEPPTRILLFLHGNGGEALHREWLTLVASPKTLIALVEYPGYGGRAGQPSQQSITKAAEDAYDRITSIYPLPVTAVGQSLGTGVASYLASKRKISRLALISPFTSAADVGASRYPMVPVRWMMSDTFDSMSFLKDVEIPLYVIHGRQDTTVGFEQGQRLFEGYRGKEKRFCEIPNAGHNDIYYAIVHSDLAKDFREFIK